jgi:tetratricopeptide (TPR) repeat protein
MIEIENDLRRADALIDVNRPQDALRIVTAVIAVAPDNVRAYCLAARCHSMTGDYGMMLAAATQATVFGPGNEWGHRLRSMALRNLGRHDEALDAAMTAVRAAPQIWQPYINLTEVLLKFPDPQRRRLAYEAAGRAVLIEPNSSSTHVTLGRVYASIGERDAARACYERALAISPDDATTHTNLAILDLDRGRLVRASRNLRSVAASNPGVESYANNVGVAANNWYARLLDIGGAVCFVQLVAMFVLPAPIGGWAGLGALALYLVGSAVGYARLPAPVRVLVRRTVVSRDGRFATLMLGIVVVLVSLMSAQEALSGVRSIDVRTMIVFPIMLGIRFRDRIRQFVQPYLLRRRYRAVVLRGDPTPGVPPQRSGPAA